MTWPQVVILIWLVLGTWESVKEQLTDRTQSSDSVAFGVLGVLTIQLGIASVLRAGGFW